ncbi:uncharacterized protein LOC119401501 [Rhipicephalus sanguineus]|uniref:uncharacterized protein LOC119401501 n=1 Tax=Rhipicephalus sanguineus TaxID=34632 RepID=UPI001895BA1B|nr:uncharacterized protein LOC119401501 [Rhipicephalus sanguineus]
MAALKKMQLQTSLPKRVSGKPAAESNAANCDEVGDTASEKARLQQSPGKASQKPMLRSSTGEAGEVDSPAHTSKVGLRKIPDRVLQKSVTKVNAKSSHNNDAACRKKVNLQNSPGKVPQKPVLKSAAEKSNINDAACSKKAELHKSLTRVLREPVLKLEPEDSNDPDDPACNLRDTIHTSYFTALRAPVLNVEAEDLDNSPQSKKARLLRSADKVPQKLESDTEDSTDIDDPAHGKAKLRKSSPGIPWDRVLESDTDDSDDFDDPTWGKKTKWVRSPDRVPRKATLGSNAESSQSVQSRHFQEEKRRGSNRFAGKVGRDGISVKRERSEEEENTQTVKGCEEALSPVTGSSDTTQQTERQAEEPHYETRTLAPPFRKPDSKMRNTAYKCSVRGCPHANEESPVGLWLFPLPDEMDEALLRSEWLRHVPIDDTINTPLSPRVCFKHFDARKHFVSLKHRILGLKLDAVPTKLLQPLKIPRKGKLSNAFRRLPKLTQCASGTNLGQVSTSTIGVGQMPQSMTAPREVQKLQSTTCATMMQEPQSTASADILEEARSVTAGTAQESQPPTTPVMVQESKFVTSADFDVEPHSVTASGAAHKSQSTTATSPTATVQQSQSMIFADVCSESQSVETDGEPQKSQSITSAVVAAETQSMTAAGVAQESESITSADDSLASQPMETEEARKSQSTTTATNMQEPHSMTLTDVAAETQSMKAVDVAQELHPTATVVQESQSITSADSQFRVSACGN